MKHKMIWVMAGLLTAALFLSSCAVFAPTETIGTDDPVNGQTSQTTKPDDETAQSNGSDEPIPTPPPDGDLMADIVPASFNGNLEAVDPEIALAVLRYADQLLLKSLENEGNVMVSPASVFLALAMTMNGADGQTREEMVDTLADAGFSAGQINHFSRNWIALLTAAGGDKTDIAIANSIWFRDGFDADRDFLQTNADYYHAGARALDFSDEKSLDIINSWVDYNTKGLIDKIIEQINPSTVMYLINTVYFKSDWQSPFLKDYTRPGTFQTPNGDIQQDFMHADDPLLYFEMADARGMVRPYDDGRFAYIAVLPDESISPRNWLADKNDEGIFSQLYQTASSADLIATNLSLPKYEAEYEDTLNNELIDMGMISAFDGASADFSLLNTGRSKGLYISEVRHKTFISVDEKGTEAAAATSVAIDESAVMTEQELHFDRPFFYAIIDLENGLPLFAGILENPDA